MTDSDAYYWSAVREARNRVLSDPDLSIWEKSQYAANITALRNKPEKDNRIPFKSVVGAFLAGGASYAGATLGGKLLGLNGPMFQAARNAGTTFGALLGSGMVKMNGYNREDAERAYRIGFVKRAHQRGYFKKAAAAVLAVNPADFLTIPRGMAQGARGALSGAGHIVGSTLSAGKEDASIAELELEESLLREQLADALDARRTQKLRDILRKRRSR